MSAGHSAVRDLLAAHLIDPDSTPVHDIDPDQFVPPAEIANRSTSYLTGPSTPARSHGRNVAHETPPCVVNYYAQ